MSLYTPFIVIFLAGNIIALCLKEKQTKNKRNEKP